MNDAGFIIGSYLVTIGAIVTFAVVTLRRAKEESLSVADKDKNWL